MRHHSHVFRGKAESQGGGERLQRFHLAIKPRFRVLPVPIRPAHSGAQIFHAQFLKPVHGQIKTMVLVMKPLANSQSIRKACLQPLYAA